MSYVCLDIGGTSIKHSLIDDKNNIIKKGNLPTRICINENYILDDIAGIIRSYINDNVKGVCIATAGVVDTNLGEIIYAGPTIPNYKGTNFKKFIFEKFNLRASVINDVNAAALGEYWLTLEERKINICCITIGTGIGGALIINGNLIEGKNKSAGEVGYMMLGDQEIQKIASTTALVKQVEKRLKVEDNINIDGKFIFDEAIKGNKICKEEIVKIIKHIANLMKNIDYVVNPDIFILGGGIMAREEYIRPILESELSKNSIHNIDVTFAKLLNTAGMFGALYNFKKEYGII